MALLKGPVLWGNPLYQDHVFYNLFLVKKIEGQDFFAGSKTTFEDKINKLKSKPDKKVLEEEYIKVIFSIISGSPRRNKVPVIRTEAPERQGNH